MKPHSVFSCRALKEVSRVCALTHFLMEGKTRGDGRLMGTRERFLFGPPVTHNSFAASRSITVGSHSACRSEVAFRSIESKIPNEQEPICPLRFRRHFEAMARRAPGGAGKCGKDFWPGYPGRRSRTRFAGAIVFHPFGVSKRPAAHRKL